MVWPVIVIVVVVIAIGLYYYRKDRGTKGYRLNRLCFGCQKRYPDTLSSCPTCGEKYFDYNQK